MIDTKTIIDAVLAQLVAELTVQLTPTVTTAVVEHIRKASQAEGMAILSLQPDALTLPMKDLITSDNEFSQTLWQFVREESRDVVNDMDFATEDRVHDLVDNRVRDYLRENLSDRISEAVDDAINDHMREADYVESHEVDDNVDLEQHDLFTELRDKVEELDQQINKLVNGEKPDTQNIASPFYVQGTDHLTDEFVTAVRVAMRHIINQDR